MSLERNARLLVEDYMFNRYPTWAGLQDDAFVADAVAPLRKQIEKAQQKLSADSFSRWQQTGNFTEAVETITAVCQAAPRLYSGAPNNQDDLALFHHPALNKAELVGHLRDLLYGTEASPKRLERFATWAIQEGLPLNWTLPTYLLFVTNPDAEFHVKPTLTRWLLKFFGKPKQSFSKLPTATSYKKITQLASNIAAELNLDIIGLMAMVKVAYEEAEKIGRLRGEATAELEPMLKEEPAIYQPSIKAMKKQPKVTMTQLAKTLFQEKERLNIWLSAIERKKQVVFYGPPGTGKTYTAQHLAQYIIGGGNGFTEIVQFHPAYSYEDFIIGLRPETDAQGNLTYAWKNGRFLSFCHRAAQTDAPCVLIIDEINRANLARVFGELMYLLEYRGAEHTITLPNGDPFSIPKNVRIIGTMNTADRSIALVDHALRRRFAFLKLAPNFDSLRTYHENTDFDPEPLISLLEKLNEEIDNPHYELGISYFLHKDIGENLAAIWQYEIEPYLEEYFFDQADTLDKFVWDTIQSQLT